MQIRKPSKKRTNPQCSLLAKILYVLLVVWLVGVFYMRNSLEGNSNNKASIEESSGQQLTNKKLPNQQRHRRSSTTQDPYYGWQPPSHANDDTSSCTLSDCFKEKGTFETHSQCKKCDDDPNEFANIPDVPPDWVPDASMLHNMMLDGTDQNGNPWPPSLPQDYCAPLGVFGGPHDDNKRLFDEVPIRGMPPDNSASGPTIFCGVYTMEVNHAGNIRAMRETWAPHCDGFVAFSTATDPRIPALSVDHEGPEEYNNMWQKSRSIWRYIGEHYLDQFDYFILGGEDLLVIPDNLRAYLKGLNMLPEEDLFAGRRFKGYGPNNYFNSGGAGYVLSRGTLRKYYETGYDHPECNPHRHTAMEDVMIAECLRKVLNIGLTDTRDEQQHERFHPFGPGNHYAWRPSPPGAKKDWYEDYNAEWGLKQGIECCAPDSVSFHYIKKPATVRHLWSLLYNCS